MTMTERLYHVYSENFQGYFSLSDCNRKLTKRIFVHHLLI